MVRKFGVNGRKHKKRKIPFPVWEKGPKSGNLLPETGDLAGLVRRNRVVTPCDYTVWLHCAGKILNINTVVDG